MARVDFFTFASFSWAGLAFGLQSFQSLRYNSAVHTPWQLFSGTP